MRRHIQGDRQLSGGNVSQPKMQGTALDSGDLHSDSLLSLRPGSAHTRKILTPLGFARRQRPAVQPVVDLSVAGKASAQQLALQLPHLDLLVRYRVIRRCTGSLDRNLIVLPAHIAQRHSTRTGKVIQRPVAVAPELGDTGAQVAPAGNRGDLCEIDMSFVVTIEARIANVADTSVRFKRRPARLPSQRFDFDEV